MSYRKLNLLSLILLFSLCLNYNSNACLNVASKELKDGWVLYHEDEEDEDYIVPMLPSGHSFRSKSDLEQELNTLDSIYKATGDIDYLSDKGLVLIVLGRYNEAISIYHQIEAKYPNRYSTASNLGTAYELVGENKLALKWIERSIELEPKSHHESEWIHANILKLKIGKGFYLSSRELLGIDFQQYSKPDEVDLTDKEFIKLSLAIRYQLQERMSFVKPTDKYVSLLLLNLGTIYYFQKNYFDSIEVLKSAHTYADDDFARKVVEERMFYVNYELRDAYYDLVQKNENNKKHRTNQHKGNSGNLFVWISSISLTINLGLMIIILRWSKK